MTHTVWVAVSGGSITTVVKCTLKLWKVLDPMGEVLWSVIKSVKSDDGYDS